MTTLREVAQQALEALGCIEYGINGIEYGPSDDTTESAITALRAALEQQEQEPTARFKCTVVDDRHPNGVPFEQWVNAPQEEQEPVAYTGDVARRMREAGMTFHLGMPHAVVMEQMTRFHDIVCAEASIKAAAAFAHPPRREWQSLTDREAKDMAYEVDANGGSVVEFARAIEQALKEKNHE
jgi:hypothetical protein